jgi:hypothetical protein
MNKIMNIINNLDPTGLIPFAPIDEYMSEIREIEKIIKNNN